MTDLNYPLLPAILKLLRTSESSGVPVKTDCWTLPLLSKSVRLKKSLKSCICNKFPGDAG